MKYRDSLVFVVAVAVLSGLALGDREGGDLTTNTLTGSETSARRNCDAFPGNNSSLQIFQLIIQVIAGCIERSNPQLDNLSNTKGLDESIKFFRTLCQDMPIINQCLTQESQQWTRCYNNEDFNNLASIFIGFVHISLEKGCEQNGDRLAVLIDGIDRHSAENKGKNDFVRECAMFATKSWMSIIGIASNLPLKTLLVYRHINLLEDCIIDNIHGDDTFVNAAKEYLGGMADKMNCVHPVSGQLVHCKTVDDSLIDMTSVCSLHSNIDKSKPISLAIDDIAIDCLKKQHGRVILKLSDATTLEVFRVFFYVYCQRQDMTKECITRKKLAASLCLTATKYSTFKLVRENLMSVIDVGCFEEGQHLANVFYTVKLFHNSTDQKNAIITCLEDVQAASSPYKDDPSRIYQYYQQLPLIRNCIVEKVNGGSAFVEGVNSFIDQLMAKMKCVKPEDGAKVLCATINSN